MQNFVPKAKLSKKARTEMNKQQRVSWAFSPVSRVKQSKKVYSRKRLGKPNYQE